MTMQSLTYTSTSGSCSEKASYKTRRVLGVRYSALVEMALGLSAITLFDAVVGNGSHFASFSFHPYWIVLMLVMVQYGLRESLACAILASVFLLAGSLPEQRISENMYDYMLRVNHLPLLWIIVATVGGEIRSRQEKEKNALLRSLREAKEKESVIARHYNALKQVKEKLELRLTGESRSIISIYKAAGEMQALDEKKVYKGILESIQNTLRAEQFSLFLLDNGRLRHVFGHGWMEREYKQSFSSRSPLYRSVVGAKKTLNILHSVDTETLEGQGMMAVPVVDTRTTEVLGMLKIEKIVPSQLTAAMQETFRMLGQCAGMAIANARNYEKVCAHIAPYTQDNVPVYIPIAKPDAYIRNLTHAVEMNHDLAAV